LIHFNKVEITQFRNLISASFIPSPSLNIIYGSNGSGKSTILEALYYLATGSSFRTSRLSHIISHQSDCFILYSEIGESVSHRIGVKRCRDLHHQTKVDGTEITKRSELVHLLPLQVISPESLFLLLDGSEVRRNYIDWALFHVEHSYHYHLTNYLRALKQRNAQLKDTKVNRIEHWDAQLIEHGEVISGYRERYVASITPVIQDLLKILLPNVDIKISYRRGWSSEVSLSSALSLSLDNDLKLKHTTLGPHRADLVVKSDGIKCTEALSRGQLKLVVIALKLAQITQLQLISNKLPIILIDDLGAELDVEHRALLFNTVKSLGTQVFVTTPELKLIDYGDWSERKVFHVEHGKLKEVV
jgi:DNA replication and repair protein RecF